MSIALAVIGLATAWFGQALLVSRVMNRRGFHPLPWFAISVLLGPAMWPLAVVELVSGPPKPVLIRRGTRNAHGSDLFVALDRDELPERTAARLREITPHCGRIVFARVIKAGGPAVIAADAERFLDIATSGFRGSDIELQLHFGDIDRVVDDIRHRGDFNLIMRGDQPTQLFDGNGIEQGDEVCRQDVTAA